jgi:hypothetical protein
MRPAGHGIFVTKKSFLSQGDPETGVRVLASPFTLHLPIELARDSCEKIAISSSFKKGHRRLTSAYFAGLVQYRNICSVSGKRRQKC